MDRVTQLYNGEGIFKNENHKPGGNELTWVRTCRAQRCQQERRMEDCPCKPTRVCLQVAHAMDGLTTVTKVKRSKFVSCPHIPSMIVFSSGSCLLM